MPAHSSSPTPIPLRQSQRPNHNQFQQERMDLACLYRAAAHEHMHESVANHFSLRVSDSEMLINPRRHFGIMRASDLALVNFTQPCEVPAAVDQTAIGLHAPLYRRLPHVQCALHVHSPYALVLASLVDSTLYPLDQNAASLFGKIVIDKDYGGLALEEEGARCSTALAEPHKRILLLGNHGVLAVGPSLPEAWHYLYYFERAAKNLIMAYQTGKPLRFLSDKVAARVAEQTDADPAFFQFYFESLRELMDSINPDYRD